MKIEVVRPEYVTEFPEALEVGILYISEEFALTAHKCCCGCGEDVYNKLGPARWRLIKMADGRVSLDPSVGNWKYACQSHYWIRKNRVIDAGMMSATEIEMVQERDRRDRDRYIASLNAPSTQSWLSWKRVLVLASRILNRLKTVWPWR